MLNHPKKIQSTKSRLWETVGQMTQFFLNVPEEGIINLKIKSPSEIYKPNSICGPRLALNSNTQI